MGPWFQRITGALIIMIPLWVVWLIFLQIAYWLFDYQPGVGNFFPERYGSPREAYGWVGLAVITPASIALAYGFYRAELLLLRFHKGIIIDLAAARHLRAFSLSLLASVCLEIFMSGVYRWAKGAVEGPSAWLQIEIHRIQIHVALLAFIFFLVSYALVEAVRLKDENEKYF